jgi:hypothetical protein
MQYRERDTDSATRKLPFLPSVSTCRHRGSGDDVTFADTVLLGGKKNRYRSVSDMCVCVRVWCARDRERDSII